ncbi:MAG: metalloregulator ArsR/SmtB family transcription factor [Micrococcales bacterium]|nr:metalloregulator ArsR/SmtB family transcription factor [Micrococcales bacterium]
MSTNSAVPGDQASQTCCVPLMACLGQDQATSLAQRFAALGDATRVWLVSFIASQPSGEACVCELVPPSGLSQGTVSHHLRLLVDAGLLTRSRRGRWSFYGIAPGAESLAAALVEHAH